MTTGVHHIGGRVSGLEGKIGLRLWQEPCADLISSWATSVATAGAKGVYLILSLIPFPVTSWTDHVGGLGFSISH